MRIVFWIALLLPLTANAGFGGSYSRGGGGSFSRGSSFSRSYSAPSRSYSAPSRPSSSSFGGSYSRPTPTPRSAPIVRPSPTYTPPAPSYSHSRPAVEHHYYGNSGGSGFFNGYLWGSLLNRPHTTVVQDRGGYVDTQYPQYVSPGRHYGFWAFMGDLLLFGLCAVLVYFILGALL